MGPFGARGDAAGNCKRGHTWLEKAGLLPFFRSECSYKGKEKVNETEAHHLTFAQPDMKWELWVAAEGKPLVVKASSTRDIENGKMTTVETYRDWKVDGNPVKSVFAFRAPEGVKKVKIFKQGN
jgi:hypothetical protein